MLLSATLNSISILEQNWLGGAYWTPPEVATRRTHGYDFPMWFIRPFYAKETIKIKLKVKQNPLKSKSEQRQENITCCGSW